jgi:hypothetical protein
MLAGMLIRLILGLVLAGGAYFVAANSHFDIFPCTVTTEDEGRTRTEDGTCSIMAVQREPYGGEKSELTPVGYAVAVGVLGVVPLILGFIIGGFFTRKKV